MKNINNYNKLNNNMKIFIKKGKTYNNNYNHQGNRIILHNNNY